MLTVFSVIIVYQTLNPVDAHRREQKKKEFKKFKEDRKHAQPESINRKDAIKLERELAKLQHLEKQQKIDETGLSKKQSIEEKLSKYRQEKEDYSRQLQAHARKQVDVPSGALFDPLAHYHKEFAAERAVMMVDYSSSEESGSEKEKNKRKATNSDEEANLSADGIENDANFMPPMPDGPLPKRHKTPAYDTSVSYGYGYPPLPLGPLPSHPPQRAPPLPLLPPHQLPFPLPPMPLLPPPPPPGFIQALLPPRPHLARNVRPQFAPVGTVGALTSYVPTNAVNPSMTKETNSTIITAAPAVRNLKKELTKFVPASVRTKKPNASNVSLVRPSALSHATRKVNAAPDLHDSKGTAGQQPPQQHSKISEDKLEQTYAAFLKEMADFLDSPKADSKQ